MFNAIVFLEALLMPLFNFVYNETFFDVASVKKDENVIYKYDEYEVIYENDYYLEKNNERILLPLMDEFAFFVDDKIVIFYISNGSLNVLNITKDLKNIENTMLDESSFTNLNVLKNDKYYIFLTIEEYKNNELLNLKEEKKTDLIDVVLIELDNNLQNKVYKIFGGSKRESVEKVVSTANTFFLIGRKDVLTGGDFTNAGSVDGTYFLSKISKGEVEKVIALKDVKNVLSFSVAYKKAVESLIIITDDSILSFDKDLNITSKKNVKPCINGDVLENTIVLFSTDNICLIDIDSFSFVKEISYNINGSIIKLNNSYMDYDRFFDIVKYEKKELNTSSSINPIQLKALKGETTYDGYLSTPSFNNNMHGIYNINHNYSLANGIKFNIRDDVIVPKKINIVDGRIYPLNYHLLFSGKCFLNGEEISNNYIIRESGNYNVELFDNKGNKEELSFLVDTNQVLFVEEIESFCDKEITLNKPFFISYKLTTNNEIDIDYFIVDGKEYTSFNYNKTTNIVYLNFNEFVNSGLKEVNIEKMVYKDDGIKEIVINDSIFINVVKPNIKLNIESKDREVIVKVEDEYNTIRHFEIKVINEMEESVYKYPITSNVIKLPYSSKDSVVKIGLVYDIGNGIDSYQEITTLNIGSENDEICDITVTRYEDTLKEFKIEFSDNTVKKAIINDKIVYRKKNLSLYTYIIIAFLLFSISFASVFLPFYLKKRKRKI